MSKRDRVVLVLSLAWPSILAQSSAVVMQLIDAGMAGRLGANAAASIGLVASTTWLVSGLCRGAVFGFSVQTGQAVGAKDTKLAKETCRQGFVAVLLLSVVFAIAGASISGALPVWLKGEAAVLPDASAYFRIWCLFLPCSLLNEWAVQMLSATGDTKLPGLMQVVMCGLDVCFNWLFIFGLGLGVAGASLGTGMAALVSACILVLSVFLSNPWLKGRSGPHFTRTTISSALKIGLPISAEQLVTGTGYVAMTAIVARLGSIAVATHSFAITAESVCYMPAFGIAAAATSIIGQCTGADRPELSRKISKTVTLLGVGFMAVAGLVLFGFAKPLMALLSPEPAIQNLGQTVLRIEAFAEPMYGASIVITGLLRGKGDTLVPTLISLGTNWGVRIPLAALLASHGLAGVWFAMALELNVRGILFLLRLKTSFQKKKH